MPISDEQFSRIQEGWTVKVIVPEHPEETEMATVIKRHNSESMIVQMESFRHNNPEGLKFHFSDKDNETLKSYVYVLASDIIESREQNIARYVDDCMEEAL